MKMTTAMTAIASRRPPITLTQHAPVLNRITDATGDGEALSWATAPAAARAARSPPSSSTTGCAAAAGRCGCPPPTSCSTARIPGPRSAAAKPTSRQGADIPQEAGMATCNRAARESARPIPRPCSSLARRTAGSDPPCLWRRHRLDRGPRHGQRRRVFPRSTRIGAAAFANPCPTPVSSMSRHRGHHGAVLPRGASACGAALIQQRR